MFADDPYKLDLIADLEEGNITVYDQGDFTDLCRGPHVDNVKLCKHFKLIRHSGAYWKGDSKNKCCSVSTVYVSRPQKNWKHICSYWRKQKKRSQKDWKG